ncbi:MULTISPECIES: hypothetical protein [Burkholderia]|nr:MULTISPECIES: hypothetical protein [Burkholderia]MBY4728872.1 hypothetical protein [Burkholderia contaminans]MCI3968252.1 hypothetical protein [Burkholderia sp. HI4860]
MLPADGNNGPGYMFYGTPNQKADSNMYGKYYPNGNGMNVPGTQAVADSANREQAYRDAYGNLTWGAAAGAAAIAAGGPLAALPGTPIFSSGGALGSGALASPIGTGAISAGINAGSQYIQDGSINPIGVAGAFGTGAAGSYGGLLWNIGVNTVGGATTTALNNVLKGKNDSVVFGAVAGAVASAAGYGTGKFIGSGFNNLARPTLNGNSGWSNVGQWAGSSGLNIFGPNNWSNVGASIGGGFGTEAAGAATNGVKSQLEKRK